MIEFLHAPDHVLAVRISGTLTAEDYDRMFAEVEARLARNPRMAVYADLIGFKDLTVEAAAKDLGYAIAKIPEWKRFRREAVVSDRHWIQTLVKAVDPLLPGIQVRAFLPEQKDAALDWACDIDGD
ncbi:MAG: STAS/SEC14 domain-containing protein [Caulobacter sp.]|nr:STAS/SEC14 domain-containing protein [Caulobacter sp.]